MPVFQLGAKPAFPPARLADDEGLLAVGGDLSPARLREAYRNGIFPWYNEHYPIMWWSPDPRMVLFPEDAHLGKRMRRYLKSSAFQLRVDSCFHDVITNCAQIPREGEDGTWIIPEMVEAYTRLHEAGDAHSFEIFYNGELAGGLYGVASGGVFCGESMFSLRSNSSKAAFYGMARLLEAWGYRLVDCQFHTPHLERLGAMEIRRKDYLEYAGLPAPARPGRRSWQQAAAATLAASPAGDPLSDLI